MTHWSDFKRDPLDFVASIWPLLSLVFVLASIATIAYIAAQSRPASPPVQCKCTEVSP